CIHQFSLCRTSCIFYRSRTVLVTLICNFFFFKQKTAYEIGLGIPAEPLFRSSVDKQASHFVHIPGLSYSGVKSPTECQQSLFESHFASRQSLSDCPVAF